MQQSVGTAQPLCSLVIGGPFSGLLNHLNLLGPDRLPTSTAALIFVALAWLVPGLLAAAEGTAWLAGPGRQDLPQGLQRLRPFYHLYLDVPGYGAFRGPLHESPYQSPVGLDW